MLLGLDAGLTLGLLLLFGGVGAVAFILERGYVTPGGRVVPAQVFLLPAEDDVQDWAVALVGLVVNLVDSDGLVNAVDQPVAGQGDAVKGAAGDVKPPVLRDAQGRVAVPLHRNVAAAGSARGAFQHEVGRFAQVGDDVAVAADAGQAIYVEGD